MQFNSNNLVKNTLNTNKATLDVNALRGASGNIAANVAAGDSNLQKNNLAMSVSNGSRAVSNVSDMQSSAGNRTTNAGYIGSMTYTNSVNLQANLTGGYIGSEFCQIYSHDSRDHRGSSKYVGMGVGLIGLSGTVSGYAEQTIPIVQPSRNDASLGGSALAYASGNIGVNVASDSGNTQNNSVAVAVSNGSVLPPR